jgi:hypothetical protein
LIKLTKSVLLLIIMSLALATAAAQTLTGTVTNGTTNKPAAGDEVILINLTNGMEVAANTKADSEGKFSFSLKDGAVGPRLIRAVHQGVTYHQIAPPGTGSVDVKVYDVVKKIAGLSLTADVFRFQADSSSLQGIRLFAVNNGSSPPVTQMNDHNFEFYLPAGAKVLQLQARGPNGQPISADVVPQAEKNLYAINFPLRPGETQFQLEFTLPYSGKLKVDPKPLYPAEHFVVMLPKSMHFTAADSSAFNAMQDPNEADSVVQVAQRTHVGQALGFTISGTGTITDQPAQSAAQSASGGMEQPGSSQPGSSSSGSSGDAQAQPAPDNRPGGGLGVPIDAPDALQKYRWPILGAFALLLAIGGWVVTKRQGGVSAASVEAASGSGSLPLSAASAVSRATLSSSSSVGAAVRPAVAAPQSAASTNAISANAVSAPRSAMLLEALKEELFQLEIEKKQGKITPEEYEKLRAALDQTLDRALKRQQG